MGHAVLVVLVVELWAELAEARAVNEELRAATERLSAEVDRLRVEAAKSWQNSSKPSSRDTAAERKCQAAKRAGGEVGSIMRRKGKQRGAGGFGPKLVADPDEVVDYRPQQCSGCGSVLEGEGELRARRQVIDLPEPEPVVTKHRAQVCVCACGTTTVAEFPDGVRAPVSYTARVRATVVYLLARQRIPVARV